MDREIQSQETMDVGGGRRIALAPEALFMQARGAAGTWVAMRAVPYDEIRAVYRYEARDWGYLGIALAYWFAAFFLLLIGGLAARWDGWMIGAAVAAATVLLAGLAAYRVVAVPQRLLRIDAYSGALVVRNRAPGFFYQLARRLPAPETAPRGGTESGSPVPGSESAAPGFEGNSEVS
jgi:hypothetical protein